MAMLVASATFGATQTPVEPTAAQLNELQKYVYPLRTAVPDGGDDSDLGILKTLFGDAPIIGLGEATHGTREIFQMKDRMIRYMAQNMGFDIFSIEATMPESYEMNNYTVRGEGDPVKFLHGTFRIWETEEILDMVEWMRRYNGGQKKIEFTGFDMQVMDGAFRELERIYPGDETVLSVKENLRKLYLPADSLAGLPQKYFSGEVARLSKAIGGARLMAMPDSTRFWAMKMYGIVQQCANLSALRLADISSSTMSMLRSPFLRDRYMAKNIEWISRNNPGSKMVLWAHNGHIVNHEYMMGENLKRAYGDDYLAVGFALYEGTYTANESGTPFGLGFDSDNVLKTPPPTSIEHILSRLDGDIFLVDLRQMKKDGGKMEWFLEKHGMRSVGAGANQERIASLRVADAFDYLIFIRNSTGSRLLPIGK